MSERNFTQMTRKELKAYIKQNPTDDEAIRELFISRRSPDAKSYPSPHNMTQEELSEIFSNKNDNS
jgi:hypothetical protein